MNTTLINYAGESREFQITTGALYRFESAGYTLADFENAERQIRAHVALVGAAVDPGTPLDQVADKCPAFEEMSRAIVAALSSGGVELEPGEETAQGNASKAGENSAPSPASNSASPRKSLKKPAQ